MTNHQCRAARALLSWSQQELADRAKVAKQTIAGFEQGHRTPYPRTLEDIKAAMEVAGIEFLSAGEHHGEGVRFRDPG